MKVYLQRAYVTGRACYILSDEVDDMKNRAGDYWVDILQLRIRQGRTNEVSVDILEQIIEGLVVVKNVEWVRERIEIHITPPERDSWGNANPGKRRLLVYGDSP